MHCLVTGSAGHLGEALVRTLTDRGESVVGIDVTASAHTSRVASITDAAAVDACLDGVEVVFHTATLHKPHVATHSRQDFIDTNVTGTRILLEAAVAHGVRAFVFTSTTSVFGDAMRPGPGEPAVWVTEAVAPRPRNIYGVTKVAAEGLCELVHREHGLNCLILRTSRFFPEEDDSAQTRAGFADANVKANEFLHRRVDVQDVVSAHLLAAERATELGFGRYIISATTPFEMSDLAALRRDPARVVARRVPGFESAWAQAGWRMFETIERVYVNAAARRDLGWQPEYDFANVVASVSAAQPFLSPLAHSIGRKGYHDEVFDGDGPYPVD